MVSAGALRDAPELVQRVPIRKLGRMASIISAHRSALSPSKCNERQQLKAFKTSRRRVHWMASEAVIRSLAGIPGAAVASGRPGQSGSSNPSASKTRGSMVGQTTNRMNDAELIRAAQRGDHAAFEELVRQYDSAVLRLALHLTRSESDAQDIYQEAFLKAYRNIG